MRMFIRWKKPWRLFAKRSYTTKLLKYVTTISISEDFFFCSVANSWSSHVQEAWMIATWNVINLRLFVKPRKATDWIVAACPNNAIEVVSLRIQSGQNEPQNYYNSRWRRYRSQHYVIYEKPMGNFGSVERIEIRAKHICVIGVGQPYFWIVSSQRLAAQWVDVFWAGQTLTHHASDTSGLMYSHDTFWPARCTKP